MLMPKEGFSYKTGTAKQFQHSELENAVIREFCADCGTHLVSLRPDLDSYLILKVGSLDTPEDFKAPKIAICTADKQEFHLIPEGMPTFKEMPPTKS